MTMKGGRKGREREGSDSSESERGDIDDQSALAALEAHFAQSFNVPVMKSVKGKGKERQVHIGKEEKNISPVSDLKKAPNKSTAIEKASQKKQPQTVVFGETGRGTSNNEGEASSGWKKFMSSKVVTKTDEEKAASLLANKKGVKAKRKEKEGQEEEDGEDEKQAQTNDRALSELLSTTLFAPGGAGSSTVRSNGKPILGSNDTLSRLLELSQPSMTGKAQSQGRGYGAAMLKSQNMGKMPVNIRHGMRRAEVENQERELQRQKELGNYHHSIKGLLTKKEGLDLVLGTKDKNRSKRTRDKGLGMGVGKFSGGMLKLSDQDIQRINKPSPSHKRRKS